MTESKWPTSMQYWARSWTIGIDALGCAIAPCIEPALETLTERAWPRTTSLDIMVLWWFTSDETLGLG